MTDPPEMDTPKIKIKRNRKRLYEAVSQGTVASTDSDSDMKALVPKPVQADPSHTEASRIIHRYMAYSAGTALVPLPVLDMVAVTAIELRMLKRLSDHYGLAFSEQRGKALIGSLIGGLHAGLFTNSLLKVIPVVGLTAAVVPMGVLAGALTYALGKVFIHHFEAGGTLLDFNPAKVRSFFETQFEKGKQVASLREKNR